MCSMLDSVKFTSFINFRIIDEIWSLFYIEVNAKESLSIGFEEEKKPRNLCHNVGI